MGVYDHIRCDYPLPIPGANDLQYQTKDTRAQYLEDYEIRADGTLWHKSYDTEDRSDKTREGLDALIGSRTRINERWEPEPHSGPLVFYCDRAGAWLEFCAVFKAGKLVYLDSLGAAAVANEHGSDQKCESAHVATLAAGACITRMIWNI